jgi:23S rRNA (cytosine1962-C5)-methyltransferase
LAAKPTAEDGSVVRVILQKEVLGTGYYNGRTDIAVRLLTRSDEAIDADFFARRFEAIRRRKESWLPPDTDAYRLVFAEADGLPGLVVDKYGDVLVAQFHTLGMDRLKSHVVEALERVFKPRSIVERSDLAVRAAEGLEDRPVGILSGEPVQEIRFLENGRRFAADVIKGQKTGFFLDQRENRLALPRWCRGRSVLNCFSYSGGFSVAAATTARRVVSVDASRPAIEMARRNFDLNGLPAHEGDFVVGDVFDFLKALAAGEFDCIILDPPSFAKNRRQLPAAIKAYTTLNSLALARLPEGGVLVSSSCTAHVDHSTFLKILHQSSVNAGCVARVLEAREQPFDHPYHLSFPEGRYLKFVALQKSAE